MTATHILPGGGVNKGRNIPLPHLMQAEFKRSSNDMAVYQNIGMDEVSLSNDASTKLFNISVSKRPMSTTYKLNQ